MGWHHWRMNQIVTAPRNTRQTLLAFAFYDQARDLASVLNRMDLSAATRRQIVFSVLGRPPERAAELAETADFKPRQAMAAALKGEEFQTRIREIVLAAFPEKRRLVFVHIPKCAGSDLLLTLRRRYPCVHHHLALPDTTGKPELFAALRELALGLSLSDSIAVSGHVRLRWYLERQLVRFEDQVFTTVRHPRDIIYSYISFLLTRMVAFQGRTRGDVTGWLAPLGMTQIEPDPSPAYLVALGGRLLRAPAVTAPNMICHNLGTGTASSALEAMVLTDIEVTDMSRYSAWRKAKFGFEPRARENPSRPFYTPETAPEPDRRFIDEMIGEDMALYEIIQARLAAAGGLSVRGQAFG
jgi:hypothetical protein